MGQNRSEKSDSDPFERAVLRAIALLALLILSIVVIVVAALYTRTVHV
jgi:hypothetical protein